MFWIILFARLIVSLGLLNVWLLRFRKSTPFRGGASKNMKEEFLTYGLPVWFMYMIGFLKVSIAVAVLIGFWLPVFIFPAVLLLSVLMIGAVSMHIKVRDPFIKMVPAISLMLLSGFLTVVYFW
jgi:hypothetical protein